MQGSPQVHRPSASCAPSGLRNEAADNSGPSSGIPTFLRATRNIRAQQLVKAKAVAAQDRSHGILVPLPGLLAKKHPWAARAERWAWLFPSHTNSRDPRSGKQVRWRCHEGSVQRAVKAAGPMSTGRPDAASPSHAFATHALHGGAFARDVQVVLGHDHLDTTMLYHHTEAGRVPSP
jgi:integrase